MSLRNVRHFLAPRDAGGGEITATIGQVSGSSAGMVSKQTGKVEKASSVTIAAGRVENAMLGFRERHAAAARPATPRRPREDHRRRQRRVLHFAVVLVGPHGLAERDRQATRDWRSRVGLQRFSNPASAATRVSVPNTEIYF